MAKMNKVQKVRLVAEINLLRGVCRLAARHYKAEGNLTKVRHWNDLAYKGDVLYGIATMA